MKRKLGWIIGALALTGGVSQAALLPYPERQLKYPRYSEKDDVLKAVWAGWKTRFVSGGVIQGNDPSGTKMSISEGQSYGMLLSVWMNDQAAFNSIWNATEQTFWNSGKGWYGWKIGDGNFAGDADIDICGALIMASALVDSGYWTKPSGTNYKDKAITVMKSIQSNFIDAGSNYRINSWPGAGDGIRNPSYHMPGWYPMFKEFADSNKVTGMDWIKAASGAMDLIEAQPNSQYGIARNFSSGSGGSPSGGTSSPNNYDMGFDAIRVPYRMALAALWYPNTLPRAVTWCTNVWKNGKVAPRSPGMYRAADASLFGWSATAPEYEFMLTRAMWGSAAVAVASKTPEAAAAASQIGQDFSGSHAKEGVDYLTGANSDLASPSHTSKNYYAQSLGILGALVIYGRAWNVWDDLKHKWVVPDTGATFVAPLTATPASIEQTPTGTTPGVKQTSSITATLSKAVPWSLIVRGRTSGVKFSTSGTGTDIKVDFTSLKRALGTTATFQVETCDVRLTYNGVDTVNSTKAKATITITQNTGIAARAVRGDGTVRWVDGAIELQDPAWLAGDRVTVKIIDLSGRTLQTEDQTLTATAQGVRVSASVGSSLSVRILELSNGAVSRRYVLSPNP